MWKKKKVVFIVLFNVQTLRTKDFLRLDPECVKVTYLQFVKKKKTMNWDLLIAQIKQVIGHVMSSVNRQIKTLSDNLDSKTHQTEPFRTSPVWKEPIYVFSHWKGILKSGMHKYLETVLGAYHEECLILHPV